LCLNTGISSQAEETALANAQAAKKYVTVGIDQNRNVIFVVAGN
jgi:hypothetical protein